MFTSKLTRSQCLLLIIAISFSFFLAEIAVGFYTGALVLIADAFHYLTDLVGYIVAFAAFKVSERDNAPKALPFGWQRATLLGAFFNGVFLFGLGVSIFLQSIERFVSIQDVQNPKLVLIIGCVGLALNILSATILHQYSHDHTARGSTVDLRGHVPITSQHQTHRHEQSTDRGGKNKAGHDLGIAGVLLHILGDAVNNIGVIIAAVVIWKTSNPARFYADPAISMAIAVMIMCTSIPLMKRSGAILMQSTPSGVDPDDVKHDLETIPGVLAIHDLHVWVLNQDTTVASVHIVVSEESVKSVEEFMRLANIVDECFHAYGIHSATIQPEMRPVRSAGGASSSSAAGDTVGGPDGIQDGETGKLTCCVGCRATDCEEPRCCD